MAVALLAYDGLCTFEFGTMVELFATARPEFDRWYETRVAAVDEGPLRACGGIAIDAPCTLRILDRAGTIIIPGWRDLEDPAPPLLLRKLRRAHSDGARILSVCSGAFVLAESGILNGRSATTHWRYAARLAERYPRIRVDPDVLYVDEGTILTSAGSAAGIDLGLHLIRRDHGAQVASSVARRLVVPPHRDGGQQQFIESPIDSGPTSFARILDDLRLDIRSDLPVATMARRASMSPRTFARHFKATTGMTPHRWIQQERVRLSQLLLESTDDSVEEIARRTGFAQAQLLRLHFKRVVGTSPIAYRRAFRDRADGGR